MKNEGLKDTDINLKNTTAAIKDSSSSKAKKAKETLSVTEQLAKVREEENAKLEAIRMSEREKTKKVVEKERARLEAELAKEISMLESQLVRNRTIGTPSSEVEEVQEIQETIEVDVTTITAPTKAEKLATVDMTGHYQKAATKKPLSAKAKASLKKPRLVASTTTQKITTNDKPIISIDSLNFENRFTTNLKPEESFIETTITNEVTRVEETPTEIVIDTNNLEFEESQTFETTSVVEDTPVLETAVQEEESFVEVTPVVEKVSVIDEAPVIVEKTEQEEASFVEATQVAEEVSDTEAILVIEEKTVAEEAVQEEVSFVEEVSDVEQTPIIEVKTVVEEAVQEEGSFDEKVTFELEDTTVSETMHIVEENVIIETTPELASVLETKEQTLVVEQVKKEERAPAKPKLTPAQKEKVRLAEAKRKQREKEREKLALKKQKEKEREKLSLKKMKEKEKAATLLKKEKAKQRELLKVANMKDTQQEDISKVKETKKATSIKDTTPTVETANIEQVVTEQRITPFSETTVIQETLVNPIDPVADVVVTPVEAVISSKEIVVEEEPIIVAEETVVKEIKEEESVTINITKPEEELIVSEEVLGTETAVAYAVDLDREEVPTQSRNIEDTVVPNDIESEEVSVMKKDDIHRPAFITIDTSRRENVLTNPLEKEDILIDHSKNVINSLQKLREKISAQKQLERELMEREAIKTQEKDKSIFDKLSDLSKIDEVELINEDLSLFDELEAEKRRVEELLFEKDSLRSQLISLEEKYNRIINIKYNDLLLINSSTLDLSDEFLESNNSDKLKVAIEEIDREFEGMRVDYFEKLDRVKYLESENDRLVSLYRSQTNIIKDLTKQVTELNDHTENLSEQIDYLNKLNEDIRSQISLERDINKKNSMEIELLSKKKSQLESEVSKLNTNVSKLNLNLLEKEEDIRLNTQLLNNLKSENYEYNELVEILQNEISQLSATLEAKIKDENTNGMKLRDLERQKSVLESKVLEINQGILTNSKKYDAVTNFQSIVDEIDHLSKIIKDLSFEKEENRTHELLRQKDRELEELREKYRSQTNQQYPYLPYTPILPVNNQSNNDIVLQEIRKLKEEIALIKAPISIADESNLIKELKEELELSKQELKNITTNMGSNELRIKEELEHTRKELEAKRDLEVKLEEQKRLEKAELQKQIATLKEELEQSKIPSIDLQSDVKILEETKLELDRNLQEMKELTELKEREIAELEESLQSQLKAKEEEIKNLESHKDLRIKELEEAISAKDHTLNKMNDELKLLGEDDIFDPKFKREIRVLREMKEELERKSIEAEEIYKETSKNLQEEINDKSFEVDVINDQIFRLDVEYKEKRDFSSAAKEIYEKKRSKLFTELGLQEERLKDLEDDQTRANMKYQNLTESNASQLEKLNHDENEMVKEFLNRLRTNKSTPGYKKFKETQAEKESLVKELKSLKEEQSSEVENDGLSIIPTVSLNNDSFEIEETLNPNKIEIEINSLNNKYIDLQNQLIALKLEHDKRVEYEIQLRNNSQVVFNYATSVVNLEEYIKDHQSKINNIEAKTSLLDNTEDRTIALKIKADIQDSEVHRNDLKAKIDFYRRQISDLEKDNTVKNYLALINQIKKIRQVQKSKRQKAESINADIVSKTKELEELVGSNR